jgi:predicted PurR-regulated permease PerM
MPIKAPAPSLRDAYSRIQARRKRHVMRGPFPSDVRSDVGLAEKATLLIHPRTRAVTRTAFAILLVLLALWVASDLLPALTWAAVIAIAVWPIYSRFAMLIAGGRAPTVTALLFTLVTGLVLVVPVVLTVHQIAQGSEAFGRWVSQLRANGLQVPSWVAQLPIAGEYLDRWWQANLSNPGAMVEWLRGINIESITAWTGALGGALMHRVFLFVVTLIALFPMLRDGAWLADRALATADLLLGGPGERLASKVADAIRGTVNGIVAVAVVNGTVIGVAYVLAGVPHPLLFAVLTMAFAVVPFGAWIAFTTATLVLLLHGGTLWAAAGLFGFCATMMLIGDNFIQPAFIRGTTRLPFLLVLIGILGGLKSFGLVGLFLGPVVMAALLTVWRDWIGIGARADPASSTSVVAASAGSATASPTATPRWARGMRGPVRRDPAR